MALIIAEIDGALSAIIATLGLSKSSYPTLMVKSQLTPFPATTLSFLGPLVASLGALVASLVPVVADILSVVGGLLGDVLGVVAALLGLIL